MIFNVSLIVLQYLGQILPYKLEYPEMKLYNIIASDFEVFLKILKILTLRIVNQ
jgi:hypothetical protein